MTDQWGNDPFQHPPEGERGDLTTSERRQRGAVIALSAAGAFALLVGLVAFLVTRDDGTEVGTPSTSAQPTASTTTLPETTTTSEPPASSTSTTAPTTTTGPINAIADAGPDIRVGFGGSVTLEARSLPTGVGDDRVRWIQTSGPDVTSGAGSFGGRAVSFTVPSAVLTITFDLEVSGTGDPVTDQVVIRIFEDPKAVVFVDGKLGSDTGDGTRRNPYRTLRRAAAAAVDADIYLRSVGTYDETSAPLTIATTTSLYGGYDENWLRDVSSRTAILLSSRGLTVKGAGTGTLSALDLVGATAPAGSNAHALRVLDADVVTVADSRIVSGDAGVGDPASHGGASIGVVARDVGELNIVRTTVNSGRAGDGGVAFDPPEQEVSSTAGDGTSAQNRTPGVAGSGATTGERSAVEGGSGGAGGDGGTNNDGAPGGLSPGAGVAATGGTLDDRDGGVGSGGSGGPGGAGGDGGVGLLDIGERVIRLAGAPGASAGDGASGLGGNGGGGGYGPLLVRGGGGGGGGGGAVGGNAGIGGAGGGSSIGVAAHRVGVLRLTESVVAAGAGGGGAIGGLGQVPTGTGGDGGSGELGSCVAIVCNASAGGEGGGGGGGGAGGQGGQGGGGGGGASIGVFTEQVGSIEIQSSTIRAGAGGLGSSGGTPGRDGAEGTPGTGTAGGTGAMLGEARTQIAGVGAAGGPSYAWYLADATSEVVEGSTLEPGPGGNGGSGSAPGAPGESAVRNG